jgi:flagellar motor switch protein FliM
LAPVTKAEFELSAGEMGAVRGSVEWLFILRFHVSVESTSLEFHIGLPCAVFDSFGVEKKISETSWRAQLADRITQARVELRSVLTEAEIPLAELLQLKPGDLISITMDETVPVYAEGIPLFRAAVCDSNGFASARIVKDVDTVN